MGVVSRNRRKFRHPHAGPATSASRSRSITLPSLWNVSCPFHIGDSDRRILHFLVTESGCSQAKFAVRTETDELEYVVVRFSVDQDQVGLDVTIPVLLPINTERMIVVLLSQWLIMGQGRDDGAEIVLQRLPVRSLGFALLVALELASMFNLPHSGPPSGPPSGPRRWRTTSGHHCAPPSSLR